MANFTLPDGKKIKIPTDPTERMRLVTAVKNRYGVDLDDTSALDQAGEFLKAIPRGAASLALSVPEGLVALADIGDDSATLKGLRGLQKSLREDSFLAADPLYADKFTTKLGEGIGSFVPFLGAGMAGRALSVGRKAVTRPFLGMDLASPTFQLPAALAVPAGMSEQADRIQMAKELGEDVGPIAETLATLTGGVIGLTELMPITSFLKKVPKTALRNPETKDKIMQAIKYFGTGAVQEGGQEVMASYLQDFTAAGLYSDELPIGESVFDEFTIGGIIGGTANLVLKSMSGRKRSVTDSYLKDAEERYRKIEEKDFANKRKIFLDAQAQGTLDIVQPEDATVRPELELPDEIGPSPNIEISRDADGKFSLIDLQENKRLDTFENETQAIVGKDKIINEYNNKVENNKVENDLYNLGLINSSTGLAIGKRLNNKNITEVPLQVLMNYDINLSTARQKQAEEQTKIEKQITDNSKELLSRNKTRSVEQIQKQNKRLRKKLNKLDPLTSKRTNLDRASAHLKKKGLPLKETYTLEEAKKALNPQDFNQLLKEMSDIAFRASKSALTNPSISNQFIKEVAAMKNIELNFNDPAVKYAAKKWTGIENIANTKVEGARRLFLARLDALPPFTKALPFPDFRTRKHTAEETDEFVAKAGDQLSTFDLKSLQALGKDQRFLDDLVYSGRAERIEGTKNYRLVNNFEFEIARRSEGFNETPTEYRTRLEAEGKLPPEMIDEMVAEEEVKQAKLLPPTEIEQQQINYAEALEEGKTNKFAKEARKILNKTGLKETGIVISNDILSPTGLVEVDDKIALDPTKTEDAEGEYDRINDVVYVSLNAVNPDGNASDQEIQNALNKIINHEMIHALRAKDLITEKEYKYLRKLAKTRKVPATFDSKFAGKTFYQRSLEINEPTFKILEEKYPYKAEELYVEEAIAELYRARNIKPDIPPKAETIFQKVIQFFKSMGQAFRNSGYQKASDLFADIESGRVGRRTRGQVRTLRDIDQTPSGLGGYNPFASMQPTPAFSVKTKPDERLFWTPLETEVGSKGNIFGLGYLNQAPKAIKEIGDFKIVKDEFVEGNINVGKILGVDVELYRDDSLYEGQEYAMLINDKRYIGNEIIGLYANNLKEAKQAAVYEIEQLHNEGEITDLGKVIYEAGDGALVSEKKKDEAVRFLKAVVGTGRHLEAIEDFPTVFKKEGDVPLFSRQGELFGPDGVRLQPDRNRTAEKMREEQGIRLGPSNLQNRIYQLTQVLNFKRGQLSQDQMSPYTRMKLEREAYYLEQEIENLEAADRETDVPAFSVRRIDLDDKVKPVSSLSLLYDPSIEAKPPNSVKIADIVKELQAIAIKTHGKPLDKFTDDNLETIARIIAAEVETGLSAEGNIEDWYKDSLDRLISNMSVIYPELADNEINEKAYKLAIAITSNGQTVEGNLDFANKIYEGYKQTGLFPVEGTGTTSNQMKQAFNALNQLIENYGITKTLDILETDFTVKQMRYMGFKVSKELVTESLLFSSIFGSKIGGAFYPNLIGNFDTVTMDRWFMRTWGRITGTLIDGNPNVLNKNIATLRKSLSRERAESLDIDYDEMQADDDAAIEAGVKVFRDFSKKDETGKSFTNKDAADNKAARAISQIIGGNIQPKTGQQKIFIRRAMNRAVEVLAENGIDTDIATAQAVIWKPEQELYKKLGSSNIEPNDRDYGTISDRLIKEGNYDQESLDRARREYVRRSGLQESYSQTRRGLEAKGKSRFIKSNVVKEIRREFDRNFRREDSKKPSRAYTRKTGGNAQVTLSDGTTVPVDLNASHTIKKNSTAYNALLVAGVTPINFLELKPQHANVFSKAMELAENNTKSSAVYRYSIPEYQDMRMFLSADGSVGFALKPDGHLVSLFKDATSDIKNASVASLFLGVEQGGRKLDAFDTVLPDLYAMNGFKAVSRLNWNPNEAPDNWNPQEFMAFNRGQPDVVFMVYDPNNYNDYQLNDGQLVEDYADAASIQEQNLPTQNVLDIPLFSRKRRDSSQGNSSEAIARRRAVKNAEETVKRTPRGNIPHYNLNASDVAIEAAYNFNNDPTAPTPEIPKFSVAATAEPDWLTETTDRVGRSTTKKTQFESIMDVIQNPVENIRYMFRQARTLFVDKLSAVEKQLLKAQEPEWYLQEGRINPKTKKAWTEQEAEEQSRAFRLLDNNIITRTMAYLRLADRSRGVFQGMLTMGFVTDRVVDENAEDGTSESIAVIERMALVDANGKETGEYGAFMQFMAPLYQRTDFDMVGIFGTYGKIMRPEMINVKTGEAIPSPITDADRAKGKRIEKEFPEVVAAYKNYQNWNNKLVEFAQKKGILTAEQAAEWIANSHYYPYYRDMAMTEEELERAKIKAPTISGGALPQNPLDIPLKGADTPITVDPIEAISRNSLSILTAALKNDGTVKLLKDLETMGLAENMGVTRNRKFDNDGNPITDANYVHAYEDGQKYFYNVKDMEIFEALSSVGGSSTSTLTKWVGMPATLLRDTVTRDPGFIVVNILRDTLSAAVTSGAMVGKTMGGIDEGYLPVIDSFKNMFGDISDLEKFGIIGGYDFSNDEGSVKQFVERTMRRQGLTKNGAIKPQDAFFKIWDGLGELTTKSDGATRKAVYDSVYKHMKKQGATEGQAQSEAAYQALEIINFGRRGLSPIFKTVTAGIPFLNARIQGLDVLYRSFTGKYSSVERIQGDETKAELRGRIMRGAILRGATLALTTGLYYMMVSDTDEYKGARREARDDYWIIPTGTDFPLRIPIPFEVGAIFKVLPERLIDMAMGDDAFTRKAVSEAKTSLGRQLETSLNIPFTQPAFGFQALKPLAEVWFNRNSFTDSEIIPYYKQQLDPRAQSTARTNELARIFGEAFNISPMKIDYVMRGYAGTLGGYLLSMADTGTRMITGTPVLPNNVELSRLPLLRRLTFDSKKAGGLQQQFYELRGEVDQVVQTINKLNKDGRADEAVAYRSNMQGVLNVKGQVRSMERYLTKWRTRRNRLLQRDDISITVRSDLLRDMEIERDRRLAMIPELRKQANIPVASFGL